MRRRLLGIGMSCVVLAALVAQAGLIDERASMVRSGRIGVGRGDAERGRLMGRPARIEGTAPAGLQSLGLEAGRDGLLYVPAGYRPGRPSPLVVMLHGAGGNARDAMGPLRRLADEAGFILLVPESRGSTWDVLIGGFGPDVAFIERALGLVFGRYAVDPKRVAIAGFSDGASYALSLGLGNGDLFTHVMAFAPGFMAPEELVGKPRLFLSHGTKDTVLPIDVCSRRIVPRVRRMGYDVTYREFEGPHAVPPAVAAESVAWFVPPPAASGGPARELQPQAGDTAPRR